VGHRGAAKRGLAWRSAEVVPHVGLDEKAIAKCHRYLTLVADRDWYRVLYVTAIGSRRAWTASGLR